MDGFPPKQNERLSEVINKLRSQLIAGDKVLANRNLSKPEDQSTKEIGPLDTMDDKEELDLRDNENCKDWKSQEDESLSKSYLMWTNNANLCWLDSSMSLLVHSKTLSNLVKSNFSQVAKIMNGYQNAISVYNNYNNDSSLEERLDKAKEILQEVQETVLNYLTPILKYKEGEPDSAFCSLLNLINEDKQIKNLFFVEFSWIKNCIKCAVPRIKNNKKTIITLSKVEAFSPNCPISLYKCPVCESPEQKMEIKFKTLPQCLIFHFENGAGKGELESLDFELNDRKYKLSGLIKMEKSRDLTINHFVTWVRDIATDSWLECNDLNNEILSYGVNPPLIYLQDLYIVMYEAFDEKGTISNISDDNDLAINMDVDDTSSSDIPVIDISDEDVSTEFIKNDQADTRVSDAMVLGGLFKHDETDYDSDEKMSKRFDDILSDSIDVLKSSKINELENINTSIKEKQPTSKREKIPTENEHQDDASSEKSYNTTLEIDVSPASPTIDSLNDDKNGAKHSPVLDSEQFLVRDAPKIPTSYENTLSSSSISETTSVTTLILNNRKISEQINGKQSEETSICNEKLLAPSNGKETTPEKIVTPELMGNLSDRCLLMTSQNQDNNKNGDYTRKTPVKLQNSSLDEKNLAEGNGKRMDNSNITADLTPDADESCARTSGLPISRKQCVFNTECTVKKLKTMENGKSTEDAATNNIDNAIKRDDATLQNLDAQKQTPISKTCLLPLSENLQPKTVSNDLVVLESKSIDTLDAKTQNINTQLFVESSIPDKDASLTYSSEINNESPSTEEKSILYSSINEKDTVSIFETKEHSDITEDLLTKHADKCDNESFVEDEGVISDSLVRKNEVNTNLLDFSVSKQIENKKLSLTTNLGDAKQIKEDIASVKPKKQLNVQSVESQDIKGMKQQIHMVNTDFSKGQSQNSPSRPFVQLTRLTDIEIDDYVSPKATFVRPKQSKSLEDLTKTVVVKVEKTNPKFILKQTAEQAGPSKTAMVGNLEPTRKSSRISARQMKEAKKSSQETNSKNSKVNSENISTKRDTSKKRCNEHQNLAALPEIPEKSLKTPYPSKRTRSVPEHHVDVLIDVPSEKNVKKKPSKDSCAKSKLKSKPVEVGNFDIQSCLQAALSSKATSSSQILPSTNESSPFAPNNKEPDDEHDISFYTGDQVQPCSDVSESTSVNKLQGNKATNDSEQSNKDGECSSSCECNDLSLHELIECSTNIVMANVFQFFNFHKTG